MIAIPIKMAKEDSAVSPLFGKAKYFALAKNGTIKIVKNEFKGGGAVVKWLNNLGVKKILTAHMGENPFSTLLDYGIDVYFVGGERLLVKDALLKYADGELPLLTKTNFNLYLGDEEHHHHSHNNTNGGCCGNHPKKENMLHYSTQNQNIPNLKFKGIK